MRSHLDVLNHTLTREGLVGLLASLPDRHVLAQAANAEELIEYVENPRPEMIVMEMRSPAIAGAETLQQITRHPPDVRIVALSPHQQDEAVHATPGGDATMPYISKYASSRDLITAVRQACHGHHV